MDDDCEVDYKDGGFEDVYGEDDGNFTSDP